MSCSKVNFPLTGMARLTCGLGTVCLNLGAGKRSRSRFRRLSTWLSRSFLGRFERGKACPKRYKFVHPMSSTFLAFSCDVTSSAVVNRRRAKFHELFKALSRPSVVLFGWFWGPHIRIWVLRVHPCRRFASGCHGLGSGTPSLLFFHAFQRPAAGLRLIRCREETDGPIEFSFGEDLLLCFHHLPQEYGVSRSSADLAPPLF